MGEHVAPVHVDVLGPLRVRVGGTPVAVPAPRLRALMVRLALDVGRTVSVDRLVEDLWPGEPPAGAVGSLRTYLSQLRALVTTPSRPGAELIVTRGRGYALDLPPAAVDHVRFVDLLDRARREARSVDPDRVVETFDEALALWQGDALADVRDLPFAQPDVSRLEELRITAVEDRCQALVDAGRHLEAVPALEALVSQHPHRERPHAQLMLSLYRAGRAADALEVHRALRDRLAEDLGLDTSSRIDELADGILRQDPRLQAATVDGVEASVPPAERRPPRPPAPPEVVGRDPERALLQQVVDDLIAGEGGTVLLAGEPGIGKTALLEDLARTAETAGVPVHWGHSLETPGAPALWPWRQVVQSLLDGLDAADTEEVRAEPGGVGSLLDGDATADASTTDPQDLDRARFILHDAVVRLLARAAPVVVVLEDVHWADRSTLQLLTRVAHDASALGIAVAVSYRDVAPHASTPLTAALATVARSPRARTVELGGLGSADIAALVERLTGVAPDEAAVGRLRDQTAGNPFFLRQIATLPDDEAGTSGSAAAVPVGVRHVVEQRVVVLGPDVRATLEAAAVLGRSAPLDVLATTTGQSFEAVLDHVDRATEHGLLVPGGTPGTFRFVHSLVRETLDELLPPARRARLHARAADALEGVAPPEQVAEHWWAAVGLVDDDLVVAALRRAATASRRLLAHDQAETHLRRALEVLGRRHRDDPRTELAVRLELVQVMTSRQGWTASELEDVAGRVRDIADEAGIGPDLIPLWWALWNRTLIRGDLASADELAAKLLADAESHDSPSCRVAGHVATAVMRLHRRADVVGALAELAHARTAEHDSPAVRLAMTPEHLSVLLRTTEAIGHVLAGDSAAATSASIEAIEVARDLERPYAEAHAELRAAVVACLLGQPAEAVAHADAALALCGTHGFDHLSHPSRVLRAWGATVLQGAHDDARREAAQAIASLREHGEQHLLPLAVALLADMEARSGRSGEAARHVAEARRLAAESGDLLVERLYVHVGAHGG